MCNGSVYLTVQTLISLANNEMKLVCNLISGVCAQQGITLKHLPLSAVK